MKVVYRERVYLDRYTCIDKAVMFTARDYFIPSGTSLMYFRINDYSYKTIPTEDVLEIIK